MPPTSEPFACTTMPPAMATTPGSCADAALRPARLRLRRELRGVDAKAHRGRRFADRGVDGVRAREVVAQERERLAAAIDDGDRDGVALLAAAVERRLRGALRRCRGERREGREELLRVRGEREEQQRTTVAASRITFL